MGGVNWNVGGEVGSAKDDPGKGEGRGAKASIWDPAFPLRARRRGVESGRPEGGIGGRRWVDSTRRPQRRNGAFGHGKLEAPAPRMGAALHKAAATLPQSQEASGVGR